MCNTCILGAHEGHKRSELIEFYLQMVLRHHVGDGIESWSSARVIVAVTTELSLQLLCIIFMGVMGVVMVNEVMYHWKILNTAPGD